MFCRILVACRPYLGEVAAHHHRRFHERIVATSTELGFDPVVTRLQWSALAKVAALAGLTPERLTQPVIDAQRKALTAAITRHRPGSRDAKALSAALFGAQTTLFHLGVLDTAPRKPTQTARPSGPPSGRRSRRGWRPPDQLHRPVSSWQGLAGCRAVVLEALMVTVEVDPARVESRLAAGEIGCPCCVDGTLGGWGHARPRSGGGCGGSGGLGERGAAPAW